MNLFIDIEIIAGSILMVYNIVRFARFIKSQRDVLSSDDSRDSSWGAIGLVLLVFFLFGYLFIAASGRADLIMAAVLFFGSVFVFIAENLMFHLMDTVKKRSIDIAETLIGVVEARDENLNGHSRYVQELTMCLYRHLPQEMQNRINPVSLEYAALMHDIGKLAIPDAILHKPGKLTEEEWIIMRKHANLGVELLKPLKSFEEINDWIRYHHERIDGKGYHKLKGDEIPLEARIISIADTYSAITMRRTYKEPTTHEEAVAIIKDVAGTQLDADLVKIFCSIPKEELAKCVPESIAMDTCFTESGSDQ